MTVGSLAILEPTPSSAFEPFPAPTTSAGPDRSDETTWAAAAALGDREAFGRLFGRFAPMVHGVLLARLPRAEVDDLVQDVFLRALRGVGSLRDGGAFGPWIAAIARNRANDHHRRLHAGAGPAAPLLDDVPDAPRPSAEASEALEALRRLPEAYRETLTLRLVEGMTGPEIAERTGMTPASVRVNLHRGMKRLRDLLGDRVADDRDGRAGETR
jgi:RNA polymerase sigma-70 factor (ECF subfamily)